MAVSKSKQPAIKPAVKMVSRADGRPTRELVAIALLIMLVLVDDNDKAELENVASEGNKALYIVTQLLVMRTNICSCILLTFLSFSISAQVPVRFEPRHKVALVNQWIRLLDVRLPPRDTSLLHIHEIPSFFIPLSTTAVGIKVKGQPPQESKFTLGATWYNGFENGPLIHKVWNNDTNVLHIIDLELLSATKRELTNNFELPNSKIDFENEKIRVYKTEIMPNQTLGLPVSKTPLVFIFLSGPVLQIRSARTKRVYQQKAGSFRWLESGQAFSIKNTQMQPAQTILILLK
jgi:hypothetical protein